MNVFILNTNSMQLIIADLFKKQCSINNEECLLIYRNLKGKKGDSQIESATRLKKLKEWENVYFVDLYVGRNSFKKIYHDIKAYHKIISILKKNEPVEKMIFGNYSNILFRGIANHFQGFTKIYFIDEGSSTLKFFKDREENKYYEDLKGIKKLKQFIFYYTRLMFGINYRHPSQAITFFTNWELNSTPKTNVVKYKLFETLIDKKIRKGLVFFLGQPLVDYGFTDLDTYVNELKLIRNSLKDKELVYIPHPREKTIDQHFFDLNNIEVLHLNQPIEEYLSKLNSFPETIATFFSTALTNCYRMCEEDINFMAFKVSKNLLKERYTEIDHLYDYFKNNLKANNFTIFDLHDPITGIKN